MFRRILLFTRSGADEEENSLVIDWHGNCGIPPEGIIRSIDVWVEASIVEEIAHEACSCRLSFLHEIIVFSSVLASKLCKTDIHRHMPYCDHVMTGAIAKYWMQTCSDRPGHHCKYFWTRLKHWSLYRPLLYPFVKGPSDSLLHCLYTAGHEYNLSRQVHHKSSDQWPPICSIVGPSQCLLQSMGRGSWSRDPQSEVYTRQAVFKEARWWCVHFLLLPHIDKPIVNKSRVQHLLSICQLVRHDLQQVHLFCPAAILDHPCADSTVEVKTVFHQ